MKTKDETKQKFNFWPYFGKYKLAITAYLILYAVEIVINIMFSIYVAEILVKITEGLYQEALKMFIIFTLAQIVSRLNIYLRSHIYSRVHLKVVNAISIDVAVQAFNISDKSYSDHGTANFTRRIVDDPDTIFSNLQNIVAYLTDFTTGVAMIGYIASLNIWVGLITVGSVILLSGFEFLRHRIMKKRWKKSHQKSEEVASLLNEVIRSEKDIKSLNLEQKLKTDLVSKTDEYAKESLKTSVAGRNIWEVKRIGTLLSILAIVAVSLIFMDKGLMTLAGFMIVWSNRGYVRSLGDYVGRISEFITGIKLSVERINELYEDDEYELEKFGKRTLKNVKGEISFDNVTYSYIKYRNKTDEEIKEEKEHNKKNKIKERIKTRVEIGKNKVLDKMSFKVEPNTTVAFVGKSGSGKSTILNLMAKMMETDSGKVLIDGVNIKSLSKETIRNAISLVNQFPYIFDMTIKENLLLAKPDATEEEINEAVKQSALSEFVDTLPEKLDTRVGESGIKLSGGQKQRLAIARAMLRKTPIIIFDESTSSLDNLSQNLVKQSIENIKGKGTVVIVAHRLSTIKNADVIFFLDEGKIVDQGTFNELYKRNKAFKTMFLAENI